MVFEFIITITKPLGHLIAIGNHSFNVEIKRFTNLINKFVIRLCSNNHCTRYIFTK